MSAKGWVQRKSTSWEVNGEYHRIESREHSAQTDVLEGTQTKCCGKFPNFNTTKKSASTKRWMMLCFSVFDKTRKTQKKSVSQKLVAICPKMPFCVFVNKNSARRVEPVISTLGWGLWQGRFAFVKCQGDKVYLVWSPRQAWIGQARVTAQIEVGSWFCLIRFFVAL